MEQRQDSAILICKALLNHDSVKNELVEQENILDMLIAASRSKHNYEQYLHWAVQKAELCQKRGVEVERLRTEAEIGLVMTHLGRVDEGNRKLDDAISQLDAPGSIDRMDAFIIAVKRKINALNDQGRPAEIIPLAQLILDRLDHYEHHSKEYAEDSYRLSWSDSPADRDRYIDFSRAQANGFMAGAYAMINEKEKAHEYLAYFDQSSYGQTYSARRMIVPTQMALGMYDEALATYAEMERRMTTDTLNNDYATILHSRAIVARAKGRIADAYDYQTRYAHLSKVLSDSLHKSEAHEYAARYHDQEQKLEIQEKNAEAERLHLVSISVVFIALLAIVFALYFFYQKRIVSKKNRVLVRMINDTLPENVGDSDKGSLQYDLIDKNGESDLFGHIDIVIRNEQLYANASLQRQDICNRFGISRHTLNDLLSEHTRGLSFPQYINTIRLEEALRMLHDEHSKTIATIASAVGFTPANLRDKFKQKYGVTPTEYRQNL